MKRFFQFSVLFICFCATSYGQKSHKPGQYEINNSPEWAQLMYGENPNVFEVDAKYKAYYSGQQFEKNFNTQYYKRWRRSVADFIGTTGFVDDSKIEEFDNLLAERASNYSEAKSGTWSVIGPMQVYAEDGS
ncbi:MAG: hypothetical protein ACI9J3_004042, partial [Parvicellaceae bacterium]